jgi:glycosyltransferase involved in cell wall biosynthesis
VATEDDRDLIEKWGGQVKQQCQVGTAVISSIPHIQRKAGEFRLVWSGQHIPGKALALALETMARLQKKPGYHLDILGTGPLTSKCQSLSKRLGIEHLITWHGRLAQPDAIAVMSKAHALLHTSISEGTPAVVLEALALGLPVICHDACGMQTAITEHCGVKVRLHDRETSVNGFRAAIEEVADDCVYHALSAGAIDRARELTWDKKVASIAAAYASVSGCHRS